MTSAIPTRTRIASAVAVLAAMLPLAAFSAAPAAADGHPDLTLDVAVGADTLYGDVTPVTLGAVNGTADWGYNASFRAVLAPGASYVAGSSTTGLSTLPDPTVIDDEPSPGETTLLWENVADVAPNNTLPLSFSMAHETVAAPTGPVPCADTVCVGELLPVAADVFVHDDARFVPDFDPVTGEPVPGPESFTGSASDAGSTELVPFRVELSEPNAEGEILRGVHAHATEYTITITNNLVRPTTDLALDLLLPAGLEFLGCGGIDHTTDAPTNPGSAAEYPGAPSLEATPSPADCVAPAVVDTAAIAGHALVDDGVHTMLSWPALGVVAAGDTYELTFAAGIPIRENTLDFGVAGTPATTGAQAANLDNNRGAETADEADLVTAVEAAGTFDGGAALVAASTDDHTLVRVAEDVSIHKATPDPDIAQGDVFEWSLEIETGEYRRVADLVVVDTLPDGLCPLAEGIDFDPTADPGGECAAADIAGTQHPSIPYSTSAPPVEHADGTWTVAFDDLDGAVPELALLGPSSSFTITIPTQIRRNYQEDGAYATPIVGRDGWANHVAVTGNDFVICGDGDPLCAGEGTRIDADEADGTPDSDESEAGQAAGFDHIAKYVARPLPDGSCPDPDGDWFDESDPLQAFVPFDRVCYRLSVQFETAYDTRNPVVDDFLPPGSVYEPGTAASTGLNTVDLSTVEPVVSGDAKLTWLMGVDAADEPCDFGNEDCYARPGDRFDITFATRAEADPAEARSYDLVDNLMKFAAQNTDGTYQPLRDHVSMELIEPVLTIDKSVTSGDPRVQSETIDYTLVVANTGRAPGYDAEIWDVLPDNVGCGEVTGITGGGACNAAENRIEWLVAGPIAPAGEDGDRVALGYTVTVPAGDTGSPAISAGESLTNTAGVRGYELETNRGERIGLVPADNIDPDHPDAPNTVGADDDVTVDVPGPGLRQDRVTLTVQDGNDETWDVTIGETVEFSLVLTVPEGTSIYDGVLTENMTGRLALLPGSVTVTFDDGTGGSTLPAGFVLDDATLTFPADYRNAFGTGDDVFTLTWRADVVDTDQNDLETNRIFHTGTFDWDDAAGNPHGTLDSNVRNLLPVEPVIGVTKTTDVPDDEGIRDGTVITYTVTVDNASGDRVSTANDLTVVDQLPDGLFTTAPTAISDGGVYDAGDRTITWTLPTLSPGGSTPLSYQITATEIVAGFPYLNTVDVVATSMPGTPAHDRTYETSASATVVGAPVRITKSTADGALVVGDETTFSLDLTVPSGSRLFDATAVDDLPAGLEFLGYGDCTGDADLCGALTTLAPVADTPTDGRTRLGWAFGDFDAAPDDRLATVTYDVRVVELAPAGGAAPDATPARGDELVNDAGFGWFFTDPAEPVTAPPAPGDFDYVTDPSTAAVTVLEPDVTLDKTVVGQVADDDERRVAVDETFTIVVDVTNADGDAVSAAHDIVIVDTVPEGMVVDAATITDGGILDGGTITWTLTGPLAPGATLSLGYDATLGDSTGIGGGDEFAGTATVTEFLAVPGAEHTDAHRTYAGNDDTVTVTPAFPVLDVVHDSDGTAHVGAPHTWTVTVTNTDDVATAIGVDVVDLLPDGWSYAGSPTLTVSGPGDPVVSTPSDPTLVPGAAGTTLVFADLADLEPGASLVLTFDAVPGPEALDNDDPDGPGHTSTATATADDGDGNPGNADAAYTAADDDTPVLVAGLLGDRVWHDVDGDGRQGDGEPGLNGVTVHLLDAADPDGTPLATQVTATVDSEDGVYLFDGLAVGDYVVEFVVPDGMRPTVADVDGPGAVPGDPADPAGSGDTADSDAGGPDGSVVGDPADPTAVRTPSVALVSVDDAPAVDRTVDAGFFTPVAVGDTVWNDLDADGIHDLPTGEDPTGEPGLAGATVTLYDGDPDAGASVVGDPVVTDDRGTYRFDGLAPGTYTVQVAYPDGYTASPTDVGGDDTIDSDVVLDGAAVGVPGAPVTASATVTLRSGADDLTIDAGGYAGASLGDRVWFDLDGDGRQDDDEPGVPAATVELLVDGAVEATTVADDAGHYRFDALEPGTYTVRFTAPAGTVLTTVDADPDNRIDSDAGPAGASVGVTAPVTLVSGQANPSIDAGVVGTGAIGDLVWLDRNGDGIVEPESAPGAADGEPGIAGVTVGLVWSGPDGVLDTDDDVDLGTRVTDDAGAYGFAALPPGPYRVSLLDLPPGTAPTADADDPAGDPAGDPGDPSGDPAGPSTPRTAVVELSAGDVADDVDFGERRVADLAVDLDVDDDTVVAGDTVTLTATAANVGATDADGPVTVVTELPDGLTPIDATGDGWACTIGGPDGRTVTCTLLDDPDAGRPDGGLAAGDVAPPITVTATVDDVDGTGSPVAPHLPATATVLSPTHDPVPGNDADTVSVGTAHLADLTIAQTLPVDTVVAGGNATFTLVVGNEGPASAVGTDDHPIVVTQTVPAGLTPTAARGDGWTCTIDGPDPDAGPEPGPGAGAHVVTCARTGALAPGETLPPIAVDVAVDTDTDPGADPGAGGTILDVVAAVHGGIGTDPVAENNADSDPVTVVDPDDLPPGDDIDLTVDLHHAGDLQVGTPGTWFVDTGNNGPGTVTGTVTVVVDLPAGIDPTDAASAIADAAAWSCTIVDRTVTCTIDTDDLDPGDPGDGSGLAPGASLPTIAIAVAVGPEAAPGVTATATVTGPDDAVDRDPTNDTDTDPIGVRPLVDRWVTIAPVSSSPGSGDPGGEPADGPVAGGEGRFRVVVGNDGPNDETGPITVTLDLPPGVTVDDVVPLDGPDGLDWSCTAVPDAPTTVVCTTDGPLPVGTTSSFDIVVGVGPALTAPVVIGATVDGPSADADPGNDTAAASSDVTVTADLAIDVAVIGGGSVGAPVSWQIDVENLGPSTAAQPIEVTFEAPAGSVPASASGDGWSCTVTGLTVTCTTDADVAPGTTLPPITVIGAAPTTTGPLTATASVTTPDGVPSTDDNPANDTATATLEVTPLVDLVLTLSADGDVVAGRAATWRYTIANNGPSPATGIVLTDTLPAGLTFDPDATAALLGDGWTCSADGQDVSCTYDGTLGVGETVSLRLVTQVAVDVSETIERSATVRADGGEADATNNVDAVTFAVLSGTAPGAGPGSGGPGTGGPGSGGTGSPSGQLPATGAESVALLRLAVLLLLAGSLFLAGSMLLVGSGIPGSLITGSGITGSRLGGGARRRTRVVQ